MHRGDNSKRRMSAENFNMFQKTKPWGYHPVQVENAIRQYDKTIADLNNKIIEDRQTKSSLIKKIENLQEELREMHIQMSSLELPDATEATEHMVLDDFKNYNTNKFNDIEEPDIVEGEALGPYDNSYKPNVLIGGNDYNGSKESNSVNGNDGEDDGGFTIIQ